MIDFCVIVSKLIIERGRNNMQEVQEEEELVGPRNGNARVIEIHGNESPTATVWRSCCIDADKNAMIWFGQMLIMFSVLGFCAVMLVQADGSCDRSSPYIGLISFVLGKALSSVIDSNNQR